MLRGLTLPASWRSLLDVFRPAFRRGSTFALFALLATGLAARTTRRTVVGMLAGAGMAAAVSFHSACRFFSHHAWDVDPIGLVLARLIVDRLLPDGAPITVVVDDTLFRRWGPKVHAAFWTHDGSAQDPNALGRGNRWTRPTPAQGKPGPGATTTTSRRWWAVLLDHNAHYRYRNTVPNTSYQLVGRVVPF